MLMSESDRKKYAEFSDYLYYRLPGVLTSSTIVGHMAAFGSLDKSSFASALTPGVPPFVDVKDEVSGHNFGHCAVGTHAVGSSVGVYPAGRIKLLRRMIERFDYDPWASTNMFITTGGQLVPIVGVVVLHMLCDLGSRRAWSGSSPGGSYHSGFEFEKAVYGKAATFIC